jgi:hypothetical protein
MRLTADDVSFFWAAMGQLEPAARATFAARVFASLAGREELGPGDVDRAVRQALVGLWTPPEVTELRAPRWDRDTPGFERASKRTW